GLKAGAVGAGAAIGSAFAYSVGKAIEFDKQMHNVNSISGLSQQGLGNLSDQVLQMSKTLPQSASTLASGLYDVASSGFQGADGMTVLKAAAVSASAGMTDTATASQAITAVLNAYGLSASQAGDVSDQLFQTVNLGVTNFESLAHNVGDYIGQAKALGLSFAQTQSAIATLTLTGTTQMQAGTALGSVLNSLIRPQQALADAIKATGYSSGTAAIGALGLRGTLMLLTKQTGGSAEAMGQLFTDSQALRSVLQLTSNGGQKWAEVASKIEDPTKRAGAAQKALAEQSKSLSFQLDVARNRVDAAAISVGTKLLPILARGLSGSFDLGSHLADDLKPLQPAFAALAHAITDLAHAGGDVAGMLAPLAEDLAKLAAAPVVVLFTGLAKALELVAGLMADHTTVVMALAIAYGLSLAGGIGRVVTAIGVELVLALHRALEGMALMSAGAGGVKSALSGMLASGAASTLAFSAALAVGITAWHGYSQGANEAKDAVDKAKAAMAKPTDINGFAKARDEIAQTRDRLRAFVHEQQDKPWYSSIFDVSGNAKAAGIISQIDALDAEAAKSDLTFRRFQTAVEGVLEAGKTGPGADAFHNSMILTGKAFEDSIPLLTAAGVKVTDTFDQVKTKLDEYRKTSTGAAGGSKLVTQALQDISSGASTTADAVDKLKQGLDALIGVFLSSDEAAIVFEKSLDDLTASARKNGRSLDINTEAGRENKSAIIDSVKALVSKTEADAAAGASAETLAHNLLVGRDRLLSQAAAAGFSRAAMERLLAQYHLTPAAVNTIINAIGADPAIQKARALNGALAALHGKTVTVNLVVNGVNTLDGVATKLNHLPMAGGGEVRGPGTGTSDSILTRLSNGEFVIKADVAQQNLAFLRSLNAGTIRPAQYRPTAAPAAAAPAGGVAAAAGGLSIGQLSVTQHPGERLEQSAPRALRETAFLMGL
ncbi:MAG: phage tail tape measure protein, partial [Actinomycetes bacterium]